MDDVQNLVKVKPLEWDDFPGRGAKTVAWLQAHYMIQKWSDGRYELSASYPGHCTNIDGAERFHLTLEAAKAAAQADYEARIYAALAPATDGRAEGLREAERTAWERGRDAAADEVDRMGESYTRWLALYAEDDPERGRIRWSAAVTSVASENIRALTPEARDD